MKFVVGGHTGVGEQGGDDGLRTRHGGMPVLERMLG